MFSGTGVEWGGGGSSLLLHGCEFFGTVEIPDKGVGDVPFCYRDVSSSEQTV